MTKLIIQIPCFNEADTLAETIADLPTSIAGVDVVETLIIDDGSTDATAAEATRCGVDHIVSLPKNQGLARAFMAGLDAALAAGADIIVNTDADNQYVGEDISRLVGPIIDGDAEMVIGCRPIGDIEHFSPLKKRLQAWGTGTVRLLSGLDIDDATSGFRAFSREAALRLNVISTFTYTHETLIQAGKKGIAAIGVPIRVNPPRRDSRLFSNNWDYIRRAVPSMLRIYATYEPLKVFSAIGTVFLSAGAIPIGRFLYFFAIGGGSGHVQSLVLGAALLLIGVQMLALGLLGELVAASRRATEELLYRQRRRGQ